MPVLFSDGLQRLCIGSGITELPVVRDTWVFMKLVERWLFQPFEGGIVPWTRLLRDHDQQKRRRTSVACVCH
jgi:hypothetical protein